MDKVTTIDFRDDNMLAAMLWDAFTRGDEYCMIALTKEKFMENTVPFLGMVRSSAVAEFKRTTIGEILGDMKEQNEDKV